ncbi:efflux RND transporter periplasmic adaptor subunit [Neptunomonas antarctica]|nr:efflux RND transporter periplasmic adaptor subunit [Neptunomonas antarctica]
MSYKKSIITSVGVVVIVGVVSLPAVQSRLPFQGMLAEAAGEKMTQKDTGITRTKGASAQDNSGASTQLLVTVVEVLKLTQTPLVSGYGEVAARWTTELTAEVSGRVDQVSDKMLAGSSFKKGDVLARINSVDYESELAAAKAAVATANVTYLEQQRETRQAKERWELSGLSGKPSALTLKTPQLAEALASLASAKAALIKAEKNLARTTIIAPFNGRVSSRTINPGGYVSAGTTIGEVFATDSVEINIALNEQQFALIGSEEQAINRSVNLIDTADINTQWTARIARFQYHIDSAERTRNLVLVVSRDQAAEYLMPGTFVKASIPGKALDDLLKLPASALSREGYIWYVEAGVLQRFKADIAYRKDDYLVVRGQGEQRRLQVVRYPQSAFLPGQAVNAESVSTNLTDSETEQTTAVKEQLISLGDGA